MTTTTNYDLTHFLMLKVQEELLEQVLPAMQRAADNITEFVRDSEDDEQLVNALREASVELLIDELVKVLTRDPQAVSKFYTLRNECGLSIDTLIACYTELGLDSARRFFAREMGITADEYASAAREIPQTLDL